MIDKKTLYIVIGAVIVTALITGGSVVAGFMIGKKSAETIAVGDVSHVQNVRIDPQAIVYRKDAIAYAVKEDTLLLLKDDAVVQSLMLDDSAKEALEVTEGRVPAFLYDQDVSLDGVHDVAVFTSTGYAGVNNYYDYYIFNPATVRLEKSTVLVNISNPILDTAKRRLQSSYRSGPQWYTQDYELGISVR